MFKLTDHKSHFYYSATLREFAYNPMESHTREESKKILENEALQLQVLPLENFPI